MNPDKNLEISHWQKFTETLTSEELLVLVRSLGTDLLTGVLVKNAFQTLLFHQCILGSYVLMYIDLDGLKKVNDTFSHERGDVYLRMFGKAISLVLRSTDLAARLGGDEFVILLPYEKKMPITERKKMAEVIAGRILSEWRKLLLPYPEFCGHAALSVGSCLVTGPTRMHKAIRLADRRMYRQKNEKKQINN